METKISAYAQVYLIMILFFTLFFQEFTGWMFGCYLLFAIPFYLSPTAYLTVCLSLSTIAYYFIGADESIYSIYTILMFLVLVKYLMSTHKSLPLKKVLLNTLLCFIAYISYSRSSFNFPNGFYELLYIIIVCSVLILFLDIDYKMLWNLLPKVSRILLVFYFFQMVILGMSQHNGRSSVDVMVDSNRSGASCSLLILSIFIFSVIRGFKNCKFNTVFISIGLLLLLMTGSRSALIGLMGSAFLFFLLYGLRCGKIGKIIFFTFSFGLFVFLFAIPVIGNYVDLSRYSDINGMIESGGTNRSAIYETLIPYVIMKDFLWGYGPGHVCTQHVLTFLVNREYAHAHNIFLEAFGEMGIMGFFVFICIFVFALLSILKQTRHNIYAYMPLGLFFCIFFNGLGESFFCDVILWFIIALCIGNNSFTQKSAKYFKKNEKFI